MSNSENTSAERMPKVIGNDAELGNFILGASNRGTTFREASLALWREFHGFPESYSNSRPTTPIKPNYGYSTLWPYSKIGQNAAGQGESQYSVAYTGQSGYYASNPQDWGRKYLAENGGCVYIDLDHLEICLPEVLSAADHLVYWQAMLRLVREARATAEARLPSGQQLVVMANNSDGHGHSYGNHLNFAMTRTAFDNLLHRKPHYLLFLASYQASSIIFAGQGKVGAENNQPSVPYQLSARADYYSALTSLQTTMNRGMINTRDEALCGNSGEAADTMARLHCIFFDSTLQDVATILKVGGMQIILAMIEAGCPDLMLDALLDDPVDAVVQWSHDPGLTAQVRTVSGEMRTAVEVQWHLLEAAKRFVDAGGCEGIVPDARMIVDLWEDTLVRLEAHDLDALVGRLDWVLKLAIIQRAIAQHPEREWGVLAKHLDHQYSRMDDEGLYLAYARRGAVERLVTDEQILAAMQEPPANTRAWCRSMLLRKAESGEVLDCDWDMIRFWLTNAQGYRRSRTIYLDNPLAFRQADCAHLFDDDAPLSDVLDGLVLQYPSAESTAKTSGSYAGYTKGSQSWWSFKKDKAVVEAQECDQDDQVMPGEFN